MGHSLGSLWIVLWLITGAVHAQTRQPLRFADLPESMHAWLGEQGIHANSFEEWLVRQTRTTEERERRGEFEHLIYYALQSTRFTRLPKLEPALSARAFAQTLKESERSQWLEASARFVPTSDQLPKEAAARLREFSRVLQQPADDERLRYFQQFTRQQEPDPAKLYSVLLREYAATMRFLYRKEIVQPDASAAQVAELYQTRGHSTDTQIEANFAVYEILAMLKSGKPQTKLKRVLLVGPGLDFAPRTDLLDLFGPQSYQPFAVADALLSLGLANLETLRIDCVDINERVLSHLQRISQSPSHQLSLLSGIADSPVFPLSADYKAYFRNFGQSIGKSGPLVAPANVGARLSKSLLVRREILACLHAARLNIVTERLAAASGYDLIVVTNVFPYFNDVELLSGLTNLTEMLADRGYLVHNEPRVTAPSVSMALGIPVLYRRTILLAAPSQPGAGTPLYDFAGIHQKHHQTKKN